MKTIGVLILTVGMVSLGWASESPSEEEQLRIIEDYMVVTGQLPTGQSLSGHVHRDSAQGPPVKCGTPAILNFVTNYDRLDHGLLKSLGVKVVTRPTELTDSVDSPRGLFRVHYTTTGYNAIYGGDATAVQVADIMDSVYVYIMDTLGYPPPPQDGYEPGGDEKYDVYMMNLGSGYYGQTFADSLAFGELRKATSFIEINADPRRLPGYEDRPMDAIRVTAAHEFFHAVQFGIDWREAEDAGSVLERRYWMEMSAVWMEEEIYDDINDYYAYLEYFFDVPEQSLQRVAWSGDLHPYASCVFPIYLCERYGRDIIRDIWLLCGDLGYGPSFLRAADSAIWKTSHNTQDWATAMSEFALWNYLTGERADLTIWESDGSSTVSGYSEKENYPAIPNGKLHVNYQYPVLVTSNSNTQHSPRHNGSYYLTLSELGSATIVHDTTYWVCDIGAGEFPNCTDSFQVADTSGMIPVWHSFTFHTDTLFNIYVALGDGNNYVPTLPGGWGVNIIYQFEGTPDSLIVDRFSAPDDAVLKIDLLDHEQYRSLTYILTPASTDRAFYETPRYRTMLVGYSVNEMTPPVGVDDEPENLLPGEFALSQNYPNPFNPITTISFSLPMSSDVTLEVFNILGQRVVTLIDGRRSAGYHTVSWDGKDLASGVYLYRLSAGDFIATRKMVLLR